MKWKIPSVAIVIALVASMSVAAQAKDAVSAFWQFVKTGDFQSAVASASTLEKNNNYNEVVAVLYSMLQDQKSYQIYSFRYTARNNGEDFGAFLKQVARQNPSANANALVGVTYWEIGERDQAVDYLKKALALDSKNPYALNYLGMTWYQKDNTKYLEYSLAAIKGKPDLSEAYNNASAAYSALGDSKNAYQMLKNCLSNCRSPHPNTFYNLLNVVGDSGIGFKNRRDEYTIEATTFVPNGKLDELHALLKPNPQNYRKMLDACLREAMYGETQYFLNKIKADGIDVPINYYYAILVFLTKNDKDYDRFVKQSASREKLTYEDYYQFASNYFQLSDFKHAIEFYKKAQDNLDPADSIYEMQTASDMAAAYLSLKDYDTGIGLLRKALSVAPNDFVSLMNLGRAFRDKGDKKSARKYLQDAYDHADGDEGKAQAKRMLNSL